jgi:ABC-type transport system involved in cytochrome c biogenesis ATPase subunit
VSKKQRKEFDLSLSSYIPGFNDKNNTSLMKILGIIFQSGDDRSLAWNAHLAHVQAKAKRLITMLSSLVRMVSDLTMRRALTVYKQSAQASMTYACAA